MTTSKYEVTGKYHGQGIGDIIEVDDFAAAPLVRIGRLKPVTANATPSNDLPDDLPFRKAILKAGYSTFADLQGKDAAWFAENVSGVGEASAAKIVEYLAGEGE